LDTLQGPTLQSAFPTKTFIALCLGVAFVYFFVEIREETWADVVRESSLDKTMTPLHFYRDRDAVDLALRSVMDPSSMLKESQVLHALYDTFTHMGNGWEMSEDDAREAQMPVTHGCQFKSNEPCVGGLPSPQSHNSCLLGH
jgi:pyruvate dehydrogenase phosphatase